MSKVMALALNTAREAIRNRILYSILFFAVLMVIVSAAFGAASIGDQLKYMKDFSLFSVSLFGVVIAIVLGVNLLHQELTKKTIVNILSKPVARWQFLVGKFAGLSATLALVVGGMSAGVVVAFAIYSGGLDWGLVLACVAALLETIMVVAVALFFSSLVVTPALAGMFTAATFVAGRSAGYLTYFFGADQPAGLRAVAHSLYWALPRLDRFTIADRAVYGDLPGSGDMLALVAYALAYSALLLLLSVALFSRREFV
jgi:ABC-type transport system involved in multi-copper enzyme maturation permease subunit